MTIKIRPLDPNDDRSAFFSGDEALDLFFHRYAGQNQFRHHIGVNYVALDNDRIIGFVTVTPALLDADTAPTQKRMPPYPLPVLRLARLAVHKDLQERGIGRILLKFSLELAQKMQGEIGCVGVLVDAKPHAVLFYEKYGFAKIDVLEGQLATTPRSVEMYLPLGSIPHSR